MTPVFAILFLCALGFAIFLVYKNKRLEDQSRASVTEAQTLLDQEAAEMHQETERIRQHYETEARKVQDAGDALLAKTISDFEPLRKYEKFRDAETEAQRNLGEALREANSLRVEAQSLLDQTKDSAAMERSAAAQRAKEIREQADALLNQATRDAGRIVAEAEHRAEEIGGEAYSALRDKQLLERAAAAMRNIIEGYGDRYIIPTHSLLDDLAVEFGYDSAGQALKSARQQSRRMVEQGEAATCDYVEVNRREIAIRFVIDAFNGRVDAILSRCKNDNYGTLEQEIRDSHNLVNLNGQAFRNARILPAYLGARLAELKWAVVVNELALRAREEQRYLREQERDRQKAEEERQKKLDQAAKERELVAVAVSEAEKRFAQASAEQKAQSEQELLELRKKLEEATRRELTIAQQTIKGRIYIISNIGSFGEIDRGGKGIYKIGLTRRSARERVDELGDASVPFGFDIHAVIETENAPALEYKLHREFLAARVNKINLRKEFFRLSLSDIREVVEKFTQGKDYSGEVIWTEKARAAQYFDTLDIDANLLAKEKWIKLQGAKVERRLRHYEQQPTRRLPEAEIEGTFTNRLNRQDQPNPAPPNKAQM